MPLIRDVVLERGIRLCLWQITEPIEALPVPLNKDLSNVKSMTRRREILAVYALLESMTGRNDLVIGHDAFGRPTLPGCHVSISHTRGWAALMLSDECSVGVDIEYVSDRVCRVTDRFIRPDEEKDGLARQLINWSAKETVYKLCYEDNLQFFEMRLKSFVPLNKGMVEVENMKRSEFVGVNYEINSDFVLTYSVGK